MTSDMMICLGNSEIVRLDGKTIRISFKATEVSKKGPGEGNDVVITFPKEDDAMMAWARLNEGIVTKLRYLSLQNGYTRTGDPKPGRKGWFRK